MLYLLVSQVLFWTKSVVDCLKTHRIELPILFHRATGESPQVGGRISNVLVMREAEIEMFQEIQSVK